MFARNWARLNGISSIMVPMKPQACFAQLNGKVHAVLNWRLRQKPEDVFIAEALTADELQHYQVLQAQGLSDVEIFEALFPTRSKPVERISIELDQLTRSQLLHLLMLKLGPIPSLRNMELDDLRKLLLQVDRG